MSCVVREASDADAERRATRQATGGKEGARRGGGRAGARGLEVTRKSTLRGLPYRLINLFSQNPCYSSEKRYSVVSP